ncbi:MAG: hypothetical protein QOI26_1441 [Pseudonocardiales bacterium]|nr:hypothetical protein [Pseudonocardiales bacterium]
MVIAVSAGFGAAAVCLVVFGTSQKQLQLGVLLGLWAALIAACLIFGTGRGQPDAEAAELEQARAQAAEVHEAQLELVALQQEQLEAARRAYFSQEVELRQFGELQLVRDASIRRESELNLEISLRREIERVLAEQLGSLREEVAALRAEVVDKLGGQLRLERIETTRVIGSDLEALQHEIRRLAAGSQESLAAPPQAGPPAASEPDRRTDIVDAELVEFPPPATELPQMPRPAPEPAASADPFAGLPRLSPLPSDLDLISQPRAAATEPAAERPAGRRRAPEPEPMPEDVRYQGRRRADGDPADWFARLDS